MHPNPDFRRASEAENLAFAKAQAFGMLVVSGENGPLLSHVPFHLFEADRYLEVHLVRSNPIARALSEPCAAVMAIQGPHGYVSPDWYEIDDQVPTWNYVAVHLRGKLSPLPQAELARVIDDLSDEMEARLAPKPMWRSDKMTPSVLEKMQRQIMPFRLEIETVEGTWKLNQNKADAVRLRAADQVAVAPTGFEAAALAELMREPPQGD